MNTLTLPALYGRLPLGFLSALGVLRLLDKYTDDSPRLSWCPQDLTARLHTNRSSIQDIVNDLIKIVDSIPDDGVLLGVPINFPPPGEAPDKLLLPPAKLQCYVKEFTPTPNPEIDAWLSSLLTDLSLDEPNREREARVAKSLMIALSGKQSTRTMLQKPLERLRDNKNYLKEALLGWRRVDSVTGEYLDHQVLFDAADSGEGESTERGVPGATWLALMSYPLLRTTALGKQPITTGWHYKPRQYRTLIYPLWTEPLDVYAVVALLEHPLMDECIDGKFPKGLQLLSVFDLVCARRQRVPGRKFEGVLTPVS
jgi:hypothetical protein